MKLPKVKLVLFILMICFCNCNSKEENNFIYHSEFSSIDIISKTESLDSSLVRRMFYKLDNIEAITQKEFVKKDINKRIVHFNLSKSENVKVNFLTKNDTLIYNIENKKIKLNEIQIEYLNDFLKNLRDLKLQSNDLIFSFNLCLPENLYIENGKLQPPPPPPF